MKECIEREAAIKAVEEADVMCDIDADAYRVLLRYIEKIPAADVVPVRHGHYVGEYDGFADGNPVYDMWYCSECGCYFEEWEEKPTYNYCPNCGALMDKDGDGDV